MTHGELFRRVLSEATGRPASQLTPLLDMMQQALPWELRLEDEIPETEAQIQFAKMTTPTKKREWAAWVAEGEALARGDTDTALIYHQQRARRN